MVLNQTNLRGILAQILSVNTKYIVPKQGNWWNPQEEVNSPHTWCAYLIRSNRPRTAPFYVSFNNQNLLAVEKIATIDLQFVGEKSEDIAQSVAMWTNRSDVQEALAQVHGAIMYNDMEAKSSPFYQDGNNTVMAWNVTIRVLWYDVAETTQGRMPAVQLEGTINQL